MNALVEWLQEKVAGERAAGRSLRQIADEMGTQHQNLSNWLAGKQPSLEHCKLIATYYGVSESRIRMMAGHPTDIRDDFVAETSLTPEEETIVRAYRLADEVARNLLFSGAQVILRSQSASIESGAEQSPPRPHSRPG